MSTISGNTPPGHYHQLTGSFAWRAIADATRTIVQKEAELEKICSRVTGSDAETGVSAVNELKEFVSRYESLNKRRDAFATLPKVSVKPEVIDEDEEWLVSRWDSAKETYDQLQTWRRTTEEGLAGLGQIHCFLMTLTMWADDLPSCVFGETFRGAASLREPTQAELGAQTITQRQVWDAKTVRIIEAVKSYLDQARISGADLTSMGQSQKVIDAREGLAVMAETYPQHLAIAGPVYMSKIRQCQGLLDRPDGQTAADCPAFKAVKVTDCPDDASNMWNRWLGPPDSRRRIAAELISFENAK